MRTRSRESRTNRPLLGPCTALALGCASLAAAPQGGDTFLVHGIDAGGRPAQGVIQTILPAIGSATPPAPLEVRYPFEGSLFPPDIVAPEILWHDNSGATAWLLALRFGPADGTLYLLCDGKRVAPEIDPACLREDNPYEESPQIAGTRGWRPSEATWTQIKRQSVANAMTMTIYGLDRAVPAAGQPIRVLSKGAISFGISRDPVGAPIFYRDVPLMPTRTKEGVVKPLADDAVPLIQWRLRDISKPDAPVVMRNMPTCANCHSFSADGSRLSLDVDGPDGDKGAHAVVPTGPRMSIERDDVFSWNAQRREDPNAPISYGLFPRISPDGRYVAATIREQVYVQNYMDFRFLQTFYPTRGVLACYDTADGKIATLPGADDPEFVQSNPEWSPDSREILFIRAVARDSYGKGPRATRANDPNETQIQYDLYRIPFNGGAGGTAEPVIGASHNGKSNSFPKFSPDGKWIVFVQAKNGLLMRPDSKLCIIPASGGQPRVMRCNMEPMNSWHSWSPNGRWLAFSSKAFGPFTRIFLAHVDENGMDAPAVLLPDCTAANRAVNLPEFANLPGDGIAAIDTPAVDYRRLMKEGHALAEAGKLDRAETFLKDSLALRDNYSPTHVAYGYVLDSLSRPADAIEQYRRALALDPLNGNAHRYFAQTLIRLRQIPEAIRHLQMALRIDPLDDEACRHFGDALMLAGNPAEAEKAYRKALELNGENAFAHNNLGQLLTYAGRLDEALHHYSEAVRSRPKYASGHANLGVVLAKAGRIDDAIRSYRKAIELDPDHAAAHCNLALLLATHKNPDVRNGPEALRCAKKACELTQNKNLQSLLALAAAHAELGHFDEAKRAAEAALALLPPDSSAAADVRANFLDPIASGKPVRNDYGTEKGSER